MASFGNTRELPIFNFATVGTDRLSALGLLFASPTGPVPVSSTNPLPMAQYSGAFGPADLRDASADANFAAALVGQEINARLAALGAANYQRLTGRSLNGSAIDEALFGLNVNSILRARDSGAAVGSQIISIEGRNADVDADFAQTLLGVTANVRPGTVDEVTANYVRLNGLKDTVAGEYVLQPRESGFAATRMGRRFIGTAQNQTPVTGQASFVATTPTILLNNSASTRKVILRSIQLYQVNAPTSAPRVHIVIDTANRFSAGGTSVTPQNANTQSATASAVTGFREAPTATAAGAGTRFIFNGIMPSAAVGASLSLSFNDEHIIGTTGSLLIYIFNATTVFSGFYRIDWEEVA